jgi:catechol 2,3-dioxygenase-like lactoylglutathione lyase family enzyme
MKIHRIDHVGIIVNDLPAAKAFFLDFGLEMLGEGKVEGEWVDKVVGLHDVKAACVMLRTPDGEANIELVKFYMPSDEKGMQRPLANTLGIRHIAFAVEDIEAVVAKLKKKGAELFGEIQNYENAINYATFVGRRGLF